MSNIPNSRSRSTTAETTGSSSSSSIPKTSDTPPQSQPHSRSSTNSNSSTTAADPTPTTPSKRHQRPTFTTPDGKYILGDELFCDRTNYQIGVMVTFAPFPSTAVGVLLENGEVGMKGVSIQENVDTVLPPSINISIKASSPVEERKQHPHLAPLQIRTQNLLLSPNSPLNDQFNTPKILTNTEIDQIMSSTAKFIEVPITGAGTPADKARFTLVSYLQRAVGGAVASPAYLRRTHSEGMGSGEKVSKSSSSTQMNAAASPVTPGVPPTTTTAQTTQTKPAKKSGSFFSYVPFFGSSSNTSSSSSSSSSSTGQTNATNAATSTPTTTDPTPTTTNQTTFITKITIHDQIESIFTNKPTDSLFMFFNVGRTFIWADFYGKPKDPLACIYFREAMITCHDVDRSNETEFDILIGFETGDVVLFSPLAGTLVRYNRDGCVNKSPVTCVKWSPSSREQFLVGFKDGSVLTFCRDFEDAGNFVPPWRVGGNTPNQSTTNVTGGVQYIRDIDDNETEFWIWRSHEPYRPMYSTNPISWWQAGRRSIKGLAFSPNEEFLAIVGLDGRLRVMDYGRNKLLDTYKSYFGGFTCVSWSPDSRYILTGGQDDLISVWSVRGDLIARCEGHGSFVNCISFDEAFEQPFRIGENIGEERFVYRLVSVGDDGRICFWELILPIPSSSVTESPNTHTVHKLIPRKSHKQFIKPYSVHQIHTDPLVFVALRSNALVTSCRNGLIRIWKRPSLVSVLQQ